MSKPKVAFICVHNSCRSQMAEALSRLYATDTFEAYSAGTEIKKAINPDAVSIIKELYGVDMTETQKPKLTGETPIVDIIITMGCDVSCPYLPARHREDWGLDDPTGKGREEFTKTAEEIEKEVLELKQNIVRYMKGDL